MASQPQHPAPISIVVCGYTGFSNLGDELIATSLIQQLSAVSIESQRPLTVTVLSQNPEQTTEWLQTYADKNVQIQSIHRKNIGKTLTALNNADGFICGGGGLLQDATGLASPLYYGGLMILAKWLGCRVLAWGQGLGPFNTPLGQWLSKLGLQHCHSINVRDGDSAHVVRTLANREPRQTTDVVWGLQLPDSKKDIVPTTQSPSPYRLGLSLRSFNHWPTDKLTQLIKQYIEAHLSNQPVTLVLLPAQPEQDNQLLATVAKTLARQLSQPVTIDQPEADHVHQALQHCDSVIAMRYHIILLASLANIPTLGLAYSPKVDTLCQTLDLPYISVEQSTLPEAQPPNSCNVQLQQQLAAGNTDSLISFIEHL